MKAYSHLVAVSPEPIESFNDRVLLDAWIKEQDHEAFAALVHRYASLVLGVCRRQCRRIQDVDDAFQATFLCLMRNASKIRKPDQLASWLHGTAYRTAVAARRRQRDNVAELVEDPPMENDPLIQVSRRHELRILDEELSKLAEPYRSAIVLHWIEGFETAEVADQLRVTTAAIRGRLQRGRAQLEQRLRRRGVTAFGVLAALAAWPVDHAAAASSADAFITTQFDTMNPTDTDVDSLPDNSSLESILETGTSTMTWTTTIGCAVALAFVAIASMTSWAGNGNAQTVISSGAIAGVSGTQPANIQATGAVLAQAVVATPAQTSDKKEAGDTPATPSEPAIDTKPATLRASIETQMLEPANFAINDATISNLAAQLREATGLPIVLDPRGTEVASELRPEPTFTYEASGLPLQVALQEMLRPSALRADVRDNSVVITADTAELARHGIGTSVWINVDEDAAKKIQDALSTEITQQFVDEPLESALRLISDELKIPITLDSPALEAIGLTPDTPITADVKGVQARTLLDEILAPLELAYSFQRERLVVTSTDAVEGNRLQRIYFLDGLGMSLPIEFNSLMQAIQQSIHPDTWEALGGPSTMCPLVLSMEQRPSLIVSTTLSTHEQIESLINTLRKTNLGPDVGTALLPTTNPQNNGGGGMGGGMGSGGGMF